MEAVLDSYSDEELNLLMDFYQHAREVLQTEIAKLRAPPRQGR